MFTKKYTTYLIVYSLHYIDKDEKGAPITLKATGRLTKSIKGKIDTVERFAKVEAEIRAHFVRTFPFLTECYITHYQEIGRTREKDVIDIMNKIDLYSKEVLLKTIAKLISGTTPGSEGWDKTDQAIADLIDNNADFLN